jgi:hypothetical protein
VERSYPQLIDRPPISIPGSLNSRSSQTLRNINSLKLLFPRGGYTVVTDVKRRDEFAAIHVRAMEKSDAMDVPVLGMWIVVSAMEVGALERRGRSRVNVRVPFVTAGDVAAQIRPEFAAIAAGRERFFDTSPKSITIHARPVQRVGRFAAHDAVAGVGFPVHPAAAAVRSHVRDAPASASF